MPLNDFGITIQLFVHAVECLRHKHSNWIVMPLNVCNLDGYAVECLLHNHSTWMFMPLNVFGINILLGWLCR
jgi:hypothetical protein